MEGKQKLRPLWANFSVQHPLESGGWVVWFYQKSSSFWLRDNAVNSWLCFWEKHSK